MWLYIYLLIATITIPLAASFEPKISFAKRYKVWAPGMILTALAFIVWDIAFTRYNIWGFNKAYLIGANILYLPIEEWLFFIIIPYACLFIYACCRLWTRKCLWPHKTIQNITLIIGISLCVIACFVYKNAYTFTCFTLCGVALLVHAIWLKSNYLGCFWLTYIIHLIPFLVINGALTGAFTTEPIVWYDDTENLNIRCFTIPIEDFFYSMLLLLCNISAYEYCITKTKKKGKSLISLKDKGKETL